jgi:hypothetical protein
MNQGDDANNVMMRHLIEAIESVREDMTKVELWAYAISEFTRPIPPYEPGKTNFWLPREQAMMLEDDPKSS